MDRWDIQLAKDGLGMGCDRRGNGFPKFRQASIRSDEAAICVALRHDRPHPEIQMESAKLRGPEVLHMRSASWTYSQKTQEDHGSLRAAKPKIKASEERQEVFKGAAEAEQTE